MQRVGNWWEPMVVEEIKLLSLGSRALSCFSLVCLLPNMPRALPGWSGRGAASGGA